MDTWIQIFPSPGTILFTQIYQNVLKDQRFAYPLDEVTITLVNKQRSALLKMEVRDTFKIKLDWQTEEICGVDIYKKGNE